MADSRSDLVSRWLDGVVDKDRSINRAAAMGPWRMIRNGFGYVEASLGRRLCRRSMRHRKKKVDSHAVSLTRVSDRNLPALVKGMLPYHVHWLPLQTTRNSCQGICPGKGLAHPCHALRWVDGVSAAWFPALHHMYIKRCSILIGSLWIHEQCCYAVFREEATWKESVSRS